METRDLFERLVEDEPPLTLSASAVRARGARAARVRLAYRGIASAAAAAALITGIVTLDGSARPQPGTPRPATKPSTMPFRSDAQIGASNAKVYAVLKAEAAKYGRVINGVPILRQGVPDAGVAPLVSSSVQYALGKDSGLLSVRTSAPSQYAMTFAGSFTTAAGPCGPPSGAPALHCRRARLPGGGLLWTYSQSAIGVPDPEAAITERFAVVVDADRSALTLSFSVRPGSTPQGWIGSETLGGVGPSEVELGQVAVAAATAWQNAATP